MPHDNRSPLPPMHFNQEMADSYDRRNIPLAPIADNMHFLVRLVLEGLPAGARILCVGVGTGAEILALSKAFPGWTFTGVDPSAEMLAVCRDRLKHAGLMDRCDLIQGFVQDVPEDAGFDAVLSLLVAHFIGREERAVFYRNIHHRLKTGGYFVSSEICFDLDSAEFPAMLKNWERVQAGMGATPETLQKLSAMLRTTLSVLSPAETDALLRTSGFALPVAFFQAFLIRGVFATK
jgi:tRNA (cmo5U34)-methyltransferase